MNEELSKRIYTELKKSQPYAYLTTGKSHVHIRCPFCGDSIKHLNHCHLYIKLEPPFVFYCQRCKATGFFSRENMSLFKIKDTELRKDVYTVVKKTNKAFTKNRSVNKNNSLLIPNDTFLLKDELSNKKIQYLNNRLGYNFSLEEIKDSKIIINLFDFLDLNNINEITTKDKNFADYLDENYIGFLSYDNNYIIMRNALEEKPKMRYYMYNIFNNYQNSKRFYIIPNKINLLNEKIKVVMAEGTFDILSIFYNLYNGIKTDDTLFIAVCGTGYNGVIYQLLKMGFIDMDIIIYSDKDQPKETYTQLKRNFPILSKNKIKIYYNEKGKDFGVPKKDIKVFSSFI